MTDSVMTAAAIAEREQLIVELAGKLAQYQLALSDLVEAINTPTSDTVYKTALNAARKLIYNEGIR